MKLGALLKWGYFIKRGHFKRVAHEICSEMFLQQKKQAEAEKSLLKFYEITKQFCTSYN
jgi:hypothetical protein